MLNRKEYNLLIVDKLKELIYKYPDLRFGQLLVNTSIIEIIPSDEQVLAKDPFYEEPEVTWERMKSNRFAFKSLFN